jgi:hypothetical protein
MEVIIADAADLTAILPVPAMVSPNANLRHIPLQMTSDWYTASYQ